MIVSFGFDKGPAPVRAHKVFDVRDLTHDTKSDAFVAKEQEIVKYGQENPGQIIAVGCHKGKHRSVKLAEGVSRRLRVSRHAG